MTEQSRWGLKVLACGIAMAWPVAAPSRPAATQVLTEQSGKTVTKVYVGEPVEIRLKGQPGTGYSWVPRKSASMVKALPPLKPTRMIPGGTQVQRFRFKSKRKGIYIVSFSYDQPWSGGTTKGKTRSFTIAVR